MSHIITEQKDRVMLIRFNRADKLNALSSALLTALNAALDSAEQDATVGAVILTGSGRAFAAGADIAEMAQLADFAAAAETDFISGLWERLASCRKPVIAAVNGYAFGGGCELALMCDFIIAAKSARFAQPEIQLGLMPGAGATQRLSRAIGAAKAMEMCLTGRQLDAEEAERAGLVVRVVADEELEAEAWKTAALIAGYSLPVVRLIKEAVNAAREMPLSAGLRYERQLFYSTFGLADSSEGMQAFMEKRPPLFKHK